MWTKNEMHDAGSSFHVHKTLMPWMRYRCGSQCCEWATGETTYPLKGRGHACTTSAQNSTHVHSAASPTRYAAFFSMRPPSRPLCSDIIEVHEPCRAPLPLPHTTPKNVCDCHGINQNTAPRLCGSGPCWPFVILWQLGRLCLTNH